MERVRGAARTASPIPFPPMSSPARSDLCGSGMPLGGEPLHHAIEGFQLAAAELVRAHAEVGARTLIASTHTDHDDDALCGKAALPAVLGRVTDAARALHCALTELFGTTAAAAGAESATDAAGIPVAMFDAVLDTLLAPCEVARTTAVAAAAGDVRVVGNYPTTQAFLCTLCRLNEASIGADEANLGGPLLTVDSLSPATMAARSAMGRCLGLLQCVVEYACRGHGAGTRATTSASRCGEVDGAGPRESPRLRLLRRADTLVDFLHAALTPVTAASELYACGAAARLAVLQVLERLLSTCYADDHRHHAVDAPNRDGGEGSAEAVERSAALALRLTSDAVLSAVAAQLHAAIPVLEEIHPASGFSHTLLYDCLRHGSALARTTVAGNGGGAGGVAARQSGAAYATPGAGGKGLLDATRQAQSPLELYNCAMTFLRHAVEYRTVTSAPTRRGSSSSGGGPAALPLPAWEAAVAVLERALQEGESALAAPAAGDGAVGRAPPSSDAAPTATPAATAPTPSEAAAPATAPLTADAPPVSFAGVFTGVHQPYSTDPTPCGSPVLNPNAPAATASAHATGQVAAAASSGSVTGAPQTCDGAAGAPYRALEFPRSPPLAVDEACSTADDGESRRGRGTDRCSPALERSVPSADATLAGMTDVETLSAVGDAATSLPRTRSAAVAVSTTHANTRSSTATTTAPGAGDACTRGDATTARSLAETADPRGRVSSVAATIATPVVAAAASGPLSAGHASPCRPRHRGSGSGATASPGAPPALSVCSRGNPSAPSPPRASSTSGGAATPVAAPSLASSATLLRWRHPSHPRLTSDALALLTALTSASTRTVASMTTLVDAGVLGVLRGVLECPGCALQQRVLAILESVFVFWETLTTQSPEVLVRPDPVPSSYAPGAVAMVTAATLFREGHDTPFVSTPSTWVPQSPSATSPVLASPRSPPPSPHVPAALRAFLHAFTTFLGWDAEGWEVTHANYTRRALQMLMHVLQYAKSGDNSTRAPHKRPPRTTHALLHVVTFLLDNGVIAHIWRCLATDATQIPGLLSGTSALSSAASGPASGSQGRALMGPGRYSAPMWGYSSFLFGNPATVSLAILSDAQCTAMELLGALAEAVVWAAAGVAGVGPSSSWTPTSVAGAAGAGAAAVVPSVEAYVAFTEGLFTHLTACANCLRRCTYTRSSSHPVTPAELKALSRLLHTLRVLFTSMGAGAGTRPTSVAAAAAADARRETWRHCITDSCVLDVLASIGTSAELVGCPLPRLCMFTLRTFLNHAVGLAPPSPLRRLLPPREAAADAALHALARQPPPPSPAVGTAPVWGGNAVRASLLVTLLSRMQRRCAGQSAEASLPLRLEVLALLVDVVTAAVAATQHAAVLAAATAFTGAAAAGVAGVPLGDAVERAAEAVRVTQRLVAGIIDCRVWSGTAQELRYLGPDNTALVKETLRFLCAATQLVGATGQLWMNTSAAAALACAADKQMRGTEEGGSSTATAAAAVPRTHTLGQLMATTLVCESVSLAFGFHVVTMDLPLTLAGLVNGTRWQSGTPKPTTSATAATGATATTTGTCSAQSGRSAGVTSTASSATSSSPPTLPANGVRVRMTPCPQPIASQVAAADVHEFSDEDRRETFQVAACALAELLRCLRFLQALVLSAPVSPPSPPRRPGGVASAAAGVAGGSAAALWLPPPHAHDGTPAPGGAARWRSIAAAVVAAPSLSSAVSPRRGEATAANDGGSGGGGGGGHACEQSQPLQRQHDVVLVASPSGSTAGIVTTTVYRGVVGREGSTAAQVAAAMAVDGARAAASPAGTASSSPASGPGPASGTPSSASAVEREEENADNWRQCEPRWRRRAVCFKTAHTDAVHALELPTLDRFLFAQAKHDLTGPPHPTRATGAVRSGAAAAAAAAGVVAPTSAAAAAVALLSGEDGEAAVLSRDNEAECAITAVRFLASEKKRLHNSL